MNAVVSWLEHRQIGLYLTAIMAAGVVGLTVAGAHHLEGAIEPVLALLLFATFLGVPFAAIGKALRDGRFLTAVGALNFIVVPLVAYGLSRFVADEPVLLFGVLLVLLTPCIDYVIVFAGLAGGASERLLAAAPLLMLAQILLLPLYLLLFVGPEGVAVVEVGPFARAFLLLGSRCSHSYRAIARGSMCPRPGTDTCSRFSGSAWCLGRRSTIGFFRWWRCRVTTSSRTTY